MAVSVVLVVDPTKPQQGYAGRNVFASCAFIGCGYGRNLVGVTTMKIKKIKYVCYAEKTTWSV